MRRSTRERAPPRRGRGALLGLLLYATAGSAFAGAVLPVDALDVSADVPLQVDGTSAAPSAQLRIAADGTLSGVAPMPAAFAAQRADLVALAVQDTGSAMLKWLVLDVPYLPALSHAVPAGQPFRCLDPACDTVALLALPASPGPASVQALAFDGADMLLVLETDAQIGGVDALRAAVLRCTAGACAVDAGADALPDGARVDGLEVLPDGRWLLSFDSAGTVAGQAFLDEDVLLHDPGLASWELVLQPGATASHWAGANIDALSLPLVRPDAVFSDGFEGP